MAYSNLELEMLRQYKESTDLDVLKFVQGAMDGDAKLNYVTVAFLPQKAAQEIEEKTGKKVEGSRVVLDINAIRHIENRHGKNGAQDHSMENLEDIARMGYVIMNYDEICFDEITTTGYLDEQGKPSPMIKISKKIDGVYYVVCAVNSSKRKRNYVVTAYMKTKKEQGSNP